MQNGWMGQSIRNAADALRSACSYPTRKGRLERFEALQRDLDVMVEAIDDLRRAQDLQFRERWPDSAARLDEACPSLLFGAQGAPQVVSRG